MVVSVEIGVERSNGGPEVLFSDECQATLERDQVDKELHNNEVHVILILRYNVDTTSRKIV